MADDDKSESEVEEVDFDSMELPEGKEMWVDKYEPIDLADIVGQKNVVAALTQMAKSKLVSHMIFAGPPGIGKTTAAKCFARAVLGPGWRNNFEEYNASSEERKIGFVRKELVESASTEAIGAPFKIIFLDEADGMTPDAQNALRGTMKRYSENCVFVLACNYLNKVISPISRSRCSLMKFDSISKEDVIKRLKYILNSEGKVVKDNVIEVIALASKGDLRGAINWLQVAQAQIEHGMTDEMVIHGFTAFKPVDTSILVSDALDGNLIRVRNSLDALLMHGTSSQEILDSMSYEIVDMKIEESLKGEVLRMIADASSSINNGAPERIQFNAIFATIAASHFKGNVRRKGETKVPQDTPPEGGEGKAVIPPGKPKAFKLGE